MEVGKQQCRCTCTDPWVLQFSRPFSADPPGFIDQLAYNRTTEAATSCPLPQIGKQNDADKQPLSLILVVCHKFMQATLRAARTALPQRFSAAVSRRRWSHYDSHGPGKPSWPQPLNWKSSGNLIRTTRRGLASDLSFPATREPTIYALSTAPGRAAIAVIRVSGPACRHIYAALCPGTKPPRPRVATVRTLYAPGTAPSADTVLDSSALVLHFAGPRSATGEDMLELHVHGGPAIVKAVLGALSRCGTADSGTVRYAEPGEFTRRAFMNGRLDLTQVEALGDTLAADTEQQRRLSVRGATGKLSVQYEAWRQQLLYARGELEALIDFSEDQHFDESPGELMSSVAEQVEKLQASLQVHRQNAVRGELLRHGISVSLLGAPNAGKSSLLNRIVGREAAIVSNEAGTTRDIVEIGLDLAGYYCRFGDTAGLRRALETDAASGLSTSTISQIEQEGMRRAKARAEESDLVVVMFSFEGPDDDDSPAVLNLDAEVCEVANRLSQEKGNVVVVVNKADLTSRSPALREDVIQRVCHRLTKLEPSSIHFLSCLGTAQDHDGVQSFLNGLVRKFAMLTEALSLQTDDEILDPDLSVWQESLGASERHRALLDQCISDLRAFLSEAAQGSTTSADGVNDEADIVLAAEHLRAAADGLAKITGRGDAGDVEEVLGVVFEKFCVGK